MISVLKDIWEGFDFSYLLTILLSVIPALVCITLHELSHGAVAYALGDNTAKRMGRLTLNPLKHLDIFGLAMMVFAHVGWAKPVPVNMYNFKDPKKGMAMTALAGPVSNVLISAVFFFIYGFCLVPVSMNPTAVSAYVLEMIRLTAVISIGYAVFNIIPIPPLDGSKVLFSLLGDELYYKLMRYERYGMILLYVLVFTDRLNGPLNSGISFMCEKLIVFAEWGVKLASMIF